MDFCTSIEIDHTLFIAFSKNNTLAFIEVDILPIEFDQFTHTHTGRGKQIYDCKVSNIFTVVTQGFKILISENFFYLCARFNFMDSSDWALYNIVFLFKPRKEGGEYTTDIVYGYFA